MKKTFFILLFIMSLVALPILAACNTPAPAATENKPAAPASGSTAANPSDNKVYEFSYSVFFPPVHKNALLAQKFCDEIDKRTNGRVKITVFAGGTLTKADKVYDGVVNGLSDLGMSVVSYTKGRFPASELVELPHGYLNGWVATRVANDYYNKFKPAELDDVHVLYFHAHGPSVLLTVSKPVRQLEDMKGLVIRSTGIGAAIIGALGGKGYGAAQNEAYDLMSKNTIDGSYTPREVLEGWKQAEIVKYVTQCTDVGSTANMFVVMNKDKWNSLPADIQDVFTQVSREWIDKHGMVWTNYDISAMNYFQTFEGREVINLSATESARWVDAALPLTADFIRDLSSKGLPSAEYEKFLVEKAREYASQSPSDETIIEFNKKEFGK